MPAWVQDDDIWEKARAAVDPSKYSGDDYWKVVTTVYENMGGRVGGGKAAPELMGPSITGDEDAERARLGVRGHWSGDQSELHVGRLTRKNLMFLRANN